MRAYCRVDPQVSIALLPSSGHMPAREARESLSACVGRRTLELGARVALVGLSNATHLNGRGGVVTHTIDESDVVYVQLDAPEGTRGSSPPMKFHARFVKSVDAGEPPAADGGDGHSLPASVSLEPEHPVQRAHQMRVEAVHAARQSVQTACSCLLGKQFASSWAVDGCNAGNTGSPAFASTKSLSSSRALHEEAPRRTWCKPTSDLVIDIECSGTWIQSVDGAVGVLEKHKQTLQEMCTEESMEAASSSSVTQIDHELAQAGWAILAVAGAFQDGGRFEEACELAAGVLSLARRIPGLGMVEARASMMMGCAKFCAGRIVEARHHAQQAGVLYLHSGDESALCKCGQVDAAVTLGECNHRLWRYRESSEALLFALTKARQMADCRRQCDILAKLSQVLSEMGHSQSARQHAQEALKLSQDEDQTVRALGANVLVLLQTGEPRSAAQHAQAQLEVCVRGGSYEHHKGKERALFSLGMAQLAMGLPNDAENTFLRQQEAAVWLGDMVGEADALMGLSTALVALRQYDLALDTLREEEVLWDCIGDFMRRRRCLDRLCKMLEKMKHRNEAMEIRRREGVSVDPLAPLFSNEDFKQLHFDEDRVIINPRLCHNERPHPWSDCLVFPLT